MVGHTQLRRALVVFLLQLIVVATTHGEPAPSWVLDSSSMYKGYFGESAIVDEFYKKAGYTEVLGKWHPTEPGPDRIFRGPDGRLEAHEVKAYRGWAGKSGLSAEVNGAKMEELSNAWIEEWENRTIANPVAPAREKLVAQEMRQQRLNGGIRRVYDEVNLSEGRWRSSIAVPNGPTGVQLQEKMGPINIERLTEKFRSGQARLDALRLDEIEKRNKVMRNQRLQEFETPPKSWEDYKKAGSTQFEKCSVEAGVLTADGRLIVSVQEGATAGLLVFSLEAGVAGYQYLKGDIYKPEFERKVMDAAVKGSTVGGCTAVAVFLGATPGGVVVLGVGIGAYFIADAALTEWHRHEDAKYLNRDDIAHLGIEIDSVLDMKPDPDIPLNVGNWGK